MCRKLSSLLVASLLLGQLMVAQLTSGTFSGVVKDTSGAVIPGVTVAITNVETGITRTVVSDAQGRYRAPNLPPGGYRMQAQMSGFRREVRDGIKLSVAQEAVVDFTLSVGEVAEQVTVTAEAPLVDTTNATLSGLVDDKTIRDLPLNGRSFDQLVLLQAGTIEYRRAGSASILGGGTKISISGARPQTNSFWLDGADVNDFRNTMPGSSAGAFLGVETVREFRVLTNSYTAEYGRSAGGVITAITRSGTNEFHGTVFEFLRNSVLDARNFFDRDPDNPARRSDPPPFKRNQFGFTVGGPIRSDKTFFFGSYEGFRDRLGQTILARVPNALARQGILPGQPQLTIAPGVQRWLDLYPLPNSQDFGDGTAQLVHSASLNTNEDYFVVRADHNFSSNQSFFSRYTFDNADKTTPQSLPFQSDTYRTRNQYLVAELNSILSAATLNSFRSAFSRSFGAQVTAYQGFPSDLTFIPGVPFENGGLLQMTGFTSIGNQRNPTWNAYNLFQWSDDLTLTRGNHTLKTGVILERIRFNLDAANANAGLYSFTGGLLSFLQGNSNRFTGMLPGNTRYRAIRQSLVGFYLQEDYRIRPTLTLNLGLREEFMTSPQEVQGHFANLEDVMADWPRLGNPLFKTFKWNLAPRVGFAWDSLGNGKMVLRGGFGLFYDQPYATYWKSPAYSGGPPYTALAQLDRPPFPDAFALIDPQNPTFGDIRPFVYGGTPYTMQFNFNLQSQIAVDTALTIGYAGSQGRKLIFTGNMNIKVPVILPDGRQCFNTSSGAPNPACPGGARTRRNPKWGDVRIVQTGSGSTYNALLLRVDKRFRAGLQVGGSYTFAKIMSDAENVFGADGADRNQVMDPYNVRLDRALASFNERHNFTVNYSYDLPLARHRALGKVLTGWQVAGILKASSGAPFVADSQCCSGNGSAGSVIVERPDLLPGNSNNPVLGGPDKYFDDSVFVPSATGFYGNVARDTIIGPGLFNFDFSLLKNTALTERINLQFRTEFFNLFNRANFSTPDNVIFNSSGVRRTGVGLITDTDTSSRQVQFALKLVF